MADVGLILSSLSTGALGWDVISTLHHDLDAVITVMTCNRTSIRTKIDTSTSTTSRIALSAYRTVPTLAYLASRYINLAWLILVVVETDARPEDDAGNACNRRTTASLLVFALALCSTTLVVIFSLGCGLERSKFRHRVVAGLCLAWLLVLIFSLTLPWMVGPTTGSIGQYCAWFGGSGLYAIGLVASLVILDVLVLVVLFFLGSKRNRNIVAATVAVQLGCLVAACIVCATTEEAVYRMLPVAVMQATTTSMAGRAYRRIHRRPSLSSVARASIDAAGQAEDEEGKPATVLGSARPHGSRPMPHRDSSSEKTDEKEKETESCDDVNDAIPDGQLNSSADANVEEEREDLVKPSRYSRLWIDSRAAAAAERSGIRSAHASTFAYNIASTSSLDASSTRSAFKFVESLPPTTAATMSSSSSGSVSNPNSRPPTLASKRSILSHAEERLISAGLVLPSPSSTAARTPLRLYDDRGSPRSVDTPASYRGSARSRSYLASPALYDSSPDPRSQSHAALDVKDVMKRANFSALRAAASKLPPTPLSLPSSAGAAPLAYSGHGDRRAMEVEAAPRPSVSLPGSPRRDNATPYSRPRSSPSKTHSVVPALGSDGQGAGAGAGDEAEDALFAFRQTVEEDCVLRSKTSWGTMHTAHDGRLGSSSERPRTARGSSRKGTADERPGTSNGAGGSGPGTFGALRRDPGIDNDVEVEDIEVATGLSPVRRKSAGNLIERKKLDEPRTARSRSSSVLNRHFKQPQQHEQQQQ
ncbi:hypothetical protein FA10DRAFT_146848 [Acaromyces ingoldii]|uniref:Uncharacterized protein n=1 Tax=Acaromyces ingoldii TaxID=215250 RepID=A0A316YJB4_9BASI|nr:hypothetical protein FA10DRAFT_146848 [Acaromyces ingoldii]PWN89517.1 hypothetical protein FA10DRAFT_146848 [Acaromyces ingoldii]